MNIASLALALATALAAIVGCAQTAVAQTQDQTGAATAAQATPDDNATTGSGNSASRDDDDRNAGTSGQPGEETSAQPWRDRGPMVMRMRPAMPRRQMLRGTGAHFHFARGKARIDVTCSVQEDTEACVRAAGKLIDKIAELRSGRDRDNMSGSAGRDDEHSGAQSEDRDDSGESGERM